MKLFGFLLPLRTLMVNSQTSGGKFSAWLQDLLTTCPEVHFEEKQFFSKTIFNFFYICRYWAKVSRKIGKNIPAYWNCKNIPKLHSPCFEQNFCWIKSFYSCFIGLWAKKVPDVSREFSHSRFVNTSFYLFTQTFWGFFYRIMFFWIFYNFQRKNFLKKCVLRFLRTCRAVFSLTFLDFFFFRLWAKIFHHFEKTLGRFRLSVLYCTCSDKVFEEKVLFENIFSFLFLFQSEQNFLDFRQRKGPQSCRNGVSCV